MTAFFILMQIQKPELLAPAGNYDCFQAALNAGADAVYLGGSRFGARAYAENFTEEQLLQSIDYAHLRGKKLYMTVNTLLKPEEIEALPDYMRPYDEAGVDGVIVQDIGVFEVLKRCFPQLKLHCSTQMTLTGIDGAAFAANIGASRIVPARELSLLEIREIHERFPQMELECFIHGAMCYCYSGQCLFSSLIGGRSGNRGTCAQPCRLPYDCLSADGEILKGAYPLSLKDLSTAELLPELINAGIGSFKIEGRMKSADYVAGVTGIYRRLIDRYAESPETYRGPENEEREVLSSLYVRSGVFDGYYRRYNGKQMITLEKPSYNASDEAAIEKVRQSMGNPSTDLPIRFICTLKAGQPANLTAVYSGIRENRTEDVSVTVAGEMVQAAQNRPLAEEEICRQLSKTGASDFTVAEITVDMPEPVFLPLGRLNELRREALTVLKERLLAGYRRNGAVPTLADQETDQETVQETIRKAMPQTIRADKSFAVSVQTEEQLAECLKYNKLQRIYVSSALWMRSESCIAQSEDTEIWLDFPRIIRTHNREWVITLADRLLKAGAAGIRVSSPDGYFLAQEKWPEQPLVGDAFLYVMNPPAAHFWSERLQHMTLPYELNERELLDLLKRLRGTNSVFEMPVYGRIPLMVTANCLRKTAGKCGGRQTSEPGDKKAQNKKFGFMMLRDRKKSLFPVSYDCIQCSNLIYNSVPLSLHKHTDKLKTWDMIDCFLLAFTTESAPECVEILDSFTGTSNLWEPKTYTNGHFHRGVE